MAIIFANEGLEYLTGFWPVGDDQFLHLHLYVNDITPTRTSVNANFVRADYDTGDGSVLIDPVFVFDSGPPAGLRMDWNPVTIENETNVAGRKAYGYIMVKEGGPMICGRRFDTPIDWSVAGALIHITPSIRLSSLLPL